MLAIPDIARAEGVWVRRGSCAIAGEAALHPHRHTGDDRSECQNL